MSLKWVHVFVILMAIGISLFFGVWAIRDFQVSHSTTNLAWGAASILAGIVLIPYLFWFILKMRKAKVK